jgi:branched-chain amino acid transport system substrate-binding protein
MTRPVRASRRNVRRSLLAVPAVTAVIVAAAAGCASGSSGSSGGSQASGVQSINFGALLAQTGPSATTGKLSQQGIAAEVAIVNSTIGAGKFKLNPIYTDNQATDSVAVSAMNQLVSVNHVPATLSIYSGPTLAIAPVATRDQVVVINHGGESPQLSGASPYLFNAIPIVTDQTKSLVQYAVTHNHYKRIALYYEDNATGQGIKAILPSIVAATGAQFVGAVSFETTDTNYRSGLAKIEAMHPDAVFIGNLSVDVPGAILSQAKAIGFSPSWLGYSAIIADSTTKVGGSEANGLLADEPADVDPETSQQYAAAAAFDKEFKQLYDTTPPHQAEWAGVAVQLLGSAVLQVVNGHKPVTGPNLQAALAKISVDTNLGHISFTSKNTVNGVPESIQEVKNGQFVTVSTVGQ